MELRYKNVSVKMTMFIFTIKFEFLATTIIVNYETQSIPFSWSIESNIYLTPFLAYRTFCSYDFFPIKLFTKF
jgi:hypothetical protein